MMMGSIPICTANGYIAQLVEQHAVNVKVIGSTPIVSAKKKCCISVVVNTPHFQCGDHGFKSHMQYKLSCSLMVKHYIWDIGDVGSTPINSTIIMLVYVSW